VDDRTRRHVRNLTCALAAVLFALVHPARAGSSVVAHVTLDGIINPIKARHVIQSLDRARNEGAQLVVLSIDTPGGLVTSMQEIVGAITNSRVPVVGLVEPKSAQATSAGALILMATDVAAMLPDTRMGAAHPVGPGANLEGAIEEKATNSLVSLAKSLATRRGRPEKIAEGIVRESKSYTAAEALSEKAVDLIVGNRDELLEKLDGMKLEFSDRNVTLSTRGAARIEYPMSRTSQLFDALADPTVASILITIGVLGILYELSSPGIGLGGIVGVTSLLLGLVAMSALPIKIGGAFLILAGFIAIALEVKTPTHGVLGFGGVLSLILGAFILVDEARYFGAPQRVDWRIFAPTVVMLAGGFLGLAALATKSLKTPLQSGVEALPGAHGIVKIALSEQEGSFAGSVFVDGARWQAVSSMEIGEGEAVEVVEVLSHPSRLRVKRIDKGDA
jgi:membrane-bound serine protease (ClpP class)